MSVIGIRILGRASVDAQFDVVVWEGGAFVHEAPVDVVPVIPAPHARLELVAAIGECRGANGTPFNPPAANMVGEPDTATSGFDGARVGINDAHYGVHSGSTMQFPYEAGASIRLAPIGVVP